MKRTDGTHQIVCEQTDNKLKVTLDASQYQYHELPQYESFLAPDGLFVRGVITQSSEEALVLTYDIPAFAKSLAILSQKAEMIKRLEAARKLSVLKDSVDAVSIPFIHPENMFLISHSMVIAHRGMVGVVHPNALDVTSFFTMYKALVVYLLNPKYDYERLVTGHITVRTGFLKKIMEATQITEVEALIDEQHNLLVRQQESGQKLVKKSQFNLFKILSLSFGLVLLMTGVWLGILLDNTIPRHERIIEAHAAYMVNNFSEAVALMREDEPQTLPSSVRYMLASSYVNLAILTNDQRQVILNNLSPNSSEQELTYWIFIGRGRFREALDIAYVIGDLPLRIHAYTLIYDMIDADMEMPGDVKQRYLAHYRQEIENLVATLEGREPVNVTQTPTQIETDAQEVEIDETDEDSEE
ncbi:MAG: type VII secretion protein EssB [Defluviitaleaceae bacterium]|nr:type VII secretion protein EssB [Defluviitaleaceae bacterium]